MANTDVDPEKVLDYLLVHKLAFARQFCGTNGLAKYGNTETLRERILAWIEAGDGRLAEVLAYLDKVEGWGNQHIYLYNTPHALCSYWRDTDNVKQVLRENRCWGLLNRTKSVLLPDKPTLSTIQWDGKSIRLVWVVKRSWEERLHDEDKESAHGELIWKAYRRKTARGLISFDWDLLSRQAMLMIQRLPHGTSQYAPSGANYQNAREKIREIIHPLIDLGQFDVVSLSRAIKPLRASGEVRERRALFETIRGGKASFTSAGRKRDVADDPDLARSRSQLGVDTRGTFGNFYWTAAKTRELKEDVHTILYAKDERIGFFGERTEEEVRYVISRVRAHC